jgi:uncharacterized protein YaaR (DUF327 family)
MAKIDPLARRRDSLPLSPATRRRGTHAGEPAAEQGPTPVPHKLAPLIEAVNQAGLGLQHDPTGAHLEDYKQAVRHFLDTAINTSLAVHSEATFGLSRKAFSTIARIDVSLADLTDAVLGRQQDVLKMKELIDQIKGLIVDLYR